MVTFPPKAPFIVQHTDQQPVDLYLMHWPLAFKRTEDFQELKGPDGKVRHLRTRQADPLFLCQS